MCKRDRNSPWPGGSEFAFTFVDDTDWASIERVKPVYDLLQALGMRTTKTVWVLDGGPGARNSGATCEDNAYLEWILSLQDAGFEIALHNVAPSTSVRERTGIGLDRFKQLFGVKHILHCNHVGCEEGIYWGEARLSGWRKAIYRVLARDQVGRYRGHIQGDPLFWGDLCSKHISYVRNFVYRDIDTLSICPEMPYHDPAKPFVRYWFAGADAGNLERFLRNFTVPKIDTLVRNRGACIAYVHFAAGFVKNGAVDARFRDRLEYISGKQGWFAPASEILNYLGGELGRPDARAISPKRLQSLEVKWLAERVLDGVRKAANRKMGRYRRRGGAS